MKDRIVRHPPHVPIIQAALTKAEKEAELVTWRQGHS